VIPTDWMPHRRGSDGELVGYLVLDGDLFTPMSHLGVPLAASCDLEDAEAILEERGLAVLAERWVWSGSPRGDMVVRIVEVTSDHVRVVDDDTGAAAVVGANLATYDLPVPADTLRPA
jgi:hypothetical protein